MYIRIYSKQVHTAVKFLSCSVHKVWSRTRFESFFLVGSNLPNISVTKLYSSC